MRLHSTTTWWHDLCRMVPSMQLLHCLSWWPWKGYFANPSVVDSVWVAFIFHSIFLKCHMHPWGPLSVWRTMFQPLFEPNIENQLFQINYSQGIHYNLGMQLGLQFTHKGYNNNSTLLLLHKIYDIQKHLPSHPTMCI